jgi:cytosine/adenosine deaminase-related metal-dependent hydrolase
VQCTIVGFGGVTLLYFIPLLKLTAAAGSKITVSQPIKLYRKYKADGIFNGNKMLSGDHVLITDKNGMVNDIINIEDAGDDVEILNGIISPGFVNCHCHIELSHLKDAITPGCGLVDFVQAVMQKRNIEDDAKVKAMQAATDELYESGTVAVADICNTADSIIVKKQSTLYWNNFIEVSGFVDATADKRLAAAESVASQFSELPYPFSIVPHSPYSVSKKLFQLLNERTHGQLISIHNQEEATENDLYKNKTGGFLELYENLGIDISLFAATGTTSFKSWLPYFSRQQRIICVHNTFITDNDLKFAAFSIEHTPLNIFFCICINANIYIENTLPPLKKMIENNCKLIIGTDSYAGNNELNMLEEMKSIQKHFPSLETESILKWGTINGAEALGITEKYGSIEKGKQPGIVLIENMEGGNLSRACTAKRIL